MNIPDIKKQALEKPLIQLRQMDNISPVFPEIKKLKVIPKKK